MTLLASAPWWLAAWILMLLLVAAIEDGWRLQISDWVSGAIAVSAFLAVAIDGPVAGLWQNVVLFVAVLAIGTFMFGRGWMGGGDVKLLAACALWFDLALGWKMLVAVAIAGGLESLLIMLLRLLPWTDRQFRRITWLRKDQPLPYGVAIGAGMGWIGMVLR